MYADNITVTNHAIESYKRRIDERVSDEEAKELMEDIFKYGSFKRLRDCVFEKDAVEYTCLKDDVEIMIILRKSKKEKKVYKEAFIVTCLGDSVNRKWFKTQRLKDLGRISSSRQWLK